MRDGGVGAAVDVLEGVHRQLLRVGQIRDVHGHSEGRQAHVSRRLAAGCGILISGTRRDGEITNKAQILSV